MQNEHDASKTLEETAHRLGVSPDHLRGGLNLVEAADLLGIAASTLRRRALAGKILYSRDGRRWIFYPGDIVDYCRKRHKPAEPTTDEPGKEVEASNRSEGGRRTTEATAKNMGLI